MYSLWFLPELTKRIIFKNRNVAGEEYLEPVLNPTFENVLGHALKDITSQAQIFHWTKRKFRK